MESSRDLLETDFVVVACRHFDCFYLVFVPYYDLNGDHLNRYHAKCVIAVVMDYCCRRQMVNFDLLNHHCLKMGKTIHFSPPHRRGGRQLNRGDGR